MKTIDETKQEEKAGHTAGPWTVEDDWILSECFTRIARINHTTLPGCEHECRATTDANARLIAASPDLYRVVKSMLAAHTHHGLDLTEAFVAQARTAVAKAEGGAA